MASIFNENERKVRKLKKIAQKIEDLAPEYKALTDEELRGKTDEFRARLEKGETLDDILVEAFATVREAAERVLGMRPYFVQLMGGIALHQGRIAEMGTGEGKTLVATLPSYLNALTGKGVHVVTVNDYLATRDAAWMGKVHRFLGLTVGVISPNMNGAEKQKAYRADICYCTNNELGFDFLRDNMAVSKAQKVQRELNFDIVDEVDSILIDEARTPLIISGQGGKSSEMYKMADGFARTVSEGDDFTIEEKEKTIMLTDEGVKKAERYFKVDNLTDINNTDLYHHIKQALRAHYMMKRDRDYIVNDGEVLIVDEFTGRVMIGRRYNEGLHQAIEAKERVVIRRENRTLATITFQNFFRMYSKLSGMTGTAKTEEVEFEGIYSLDVVQIPPNKPRQRIDENDKIYTKESCKITAIVDDILKCHETGQPVLVGTASVEKSEHLSAILKRKGIRHNVLNAKLHKQEAEIVAQAGKVGMITISTNMAGRGTDIMLGGNAEFQAKQKMEKDGYPLDIIEMATSPHDYDDEKVIEAKKTYKHHYDAFKKQCDEEKEQVIALGGLRIIGTERHESRRIDNQLRGRSGRQGDPGSTVFYISLEDDIARIFGGDKIKSIALAMNFPEDEPISSPIISKQIERAQKQVEGRNFSIRKRVLSYDDVMNAQREIIYKERGKVLDGLDIHDQIIDMFGDLAENIIGDHADYKYDYQTWDYKAFNDALEQKMLPKDTGLMTPELCSCYDVYKLKDAVLEVALKSYEEKIAKAKEDGFDFGEFERFVLLKNVDAKWMDHIDSMDVLREGIGLRGYGQRDPIIAYRQEGWDMFEEMVDRIHCETASFLLKVEIQKKEDGGIQTNRQIATQSKTVKNTDQKVGRNDPCPCGSGLKYKNCCGKK